VHGVNKDFGEEGRRGRNDRRYDKLAGLLDLAEVTRTHIPYDVTDHVWPPKVLRYQSASRINTFMTNLVMSTSEDVKSILQRDYQLVCALHILAPKSVTI
jgi:hypothetical protein